MNNQLKSFLQEFQQQTQPNPFNDIERIYKWTAALEVKAFDGAIRLSNIRSFTKGKGYGSEALKWLCSLADKYQLEITGIVQPAGAGLPRDQLRKWYTRHGFVIDQRGQMRRRCHDQRICQEIQESRNQ